MSDSDRDNVKEVMEASDPDQTAVNVVDAPVSICNVLRTHP